MCACGGDARAAGINIPALLVDPQGKVRLAHSAQRSGLTAVRNRAHSLTARRAAPQEEMSEALLDKIYGVNQKGVFLCTQAVVRAIISANAYAHARMSRARAAR